MPIVRCKEFDDDGKPLKHFGCPRGKSCKFVHPDNGYWATAPRNNPVPRSLPFYSDRGRGRGRGGLPAGPRERTGSNTVSSGNFNGATGWGSRTATTVTASTTWGASWSSNTDKLGSKDKGKDKDEGSSGKSKDWGSGWGSGLNSGWGSGLDSGWGSGWDSADDPKKDEDTDKDKGKGKATESSLGGWAKEAAKNDNISWSGWGDTTTEWAGASPKETKFASNISEQSGDPGASRRSTISPVSDKRRMSETSFSTLDDKMKKSIPEKLRLSSTEPSSKADVDSPLSLIATPTVTSWRDIPSPDVQIHNRSLSLLKQTPTPDVSSHSSRAGSVVPSGAVPPGVVPTPKEIRSLRSVPFKDAKDVWNEYIDLIRRPITLRLVLIQERARHKDYKAAQNSARYTKVGRQGTVLLDENMRRIRARLERDEKAYRAAVDKLCAFEEGFDFVMHALTGRSADKSKMREELEGLKSYVGEAKSCVDGMQATGNDIETKAHNAINPVVSTSPEVKKGKEETQEVESTTPGIQDKTIDERLLDLKDKSMELHGAFIEGRINTGADVLIQGKVDEMKASLLEELGTVEEELSAKITKLSEEQASLGQDLGKLCDELAEILTSFGQAELTLQQEIDRLKGSLEEDQRLLEASEGRVRECRESLEKSTEDLSSLRQGIQTFEGQHGAFGLPTGVSEQLLGQLIASLLPVIRAQLCPDVESALQLMTSSAVDVVREHENQSRILSEMLGRFNVTDNYYSKNEVKSLSLSKRPPAASFSIGEG